MTVHMSRHNVVGEENEQDEGREEDLRVLTWKITPDLWQG